MRPVRFTPRARADTLEIVDFLYVRSGRQTLVRRFLASLEETTAMLARYPQVGRAIWVNERELRHFVVRRFHLYRIFPQVAGDEVTVVRVLRGARDVEAILQGGLESSEL